MSRILKPCGTPAAFMRHRRRHEECAECRKAWNAYYRDWSRADYALRKRLGRLPRSKGATA